jgi:hypothetical protein
LSGKALNVEDMVDLLTMKDNAGGAGHDDYILALNLLHRTRVRLHDDSIFRSLMLHSRICPQAALRAPSIQSGAESTSTMSELSALRLI